jgi:hypothetical protein
MYAYSTFSGKDRIFGVLEQAHLHEFLADRDEDDAQASVGPLVNVEVMVGREGVHAQREVERLLQLVALRSGMPYLIRKARFKS